MIFFFLISFLSRILYSQNEKQVHLSNSLTLKDNLENFRCNNPRYFYSIEGDNETIKKFFYLVAKEEKFLDKLETFDSTYPQKKIFIKEDKIYVKTRKEVEIDSIRNSLTSKYLQNIYMIDSIRPKVQKIYYRCKDVCNNR